MKNSSFRILSILAAAAGIFITACPVEYIPDDGYRSGKYGDFQWYSRNGEVTISNYTGHGSDVIIPAVIDKKPVTVIGNGSFRESENLISITIPENVTSIEDNAFLVCTSLANVTFTGNNISSPDFSNYAFNGDLREQYLTGEIGTYIRLDSSYNWTKQY